MKHVLCGIKTASDSAFWLCAASSLLSFYFDISNLIIVIPAAFIFGLILSILSKSEKMKYLSIAVFLPPFISAENLISALILLPIVFYYALCIRKNSIYPEYIVLEDIFPKTGVICAALTLIMAVRENTWVFLAGIVYLVLTVFLLRVLRQDNLENNGLSEILFLAGIIVLCILLSTQPALGAAKAFGGLIYNYIISPVIMLFSIIIYGVLKLVSSVAGLFIHTKEDAQMPEFGTAVYGLTEDALENVKVQTGNSTAILIILKIFGAFVLLTIAFLVFKWIFSSMKRSSGLSDSSRTWTEKELQMPLEADTLKITDRSNRGRIRRYYNNFCRAAIKSGVPIVKSDTSLDISVSVKNSVDYEKLSDLRSLYLRARYSEKADITLHETKTAHSLSAVLCRELKANSRE